MKTFLTILLILFTLKASTQVKISGKVMNQSDEPITGVNIFIKESYDGSTSDSAGFFSFYTSLHGEQELIISFIGYETQNIPLDLNNNLPGIQIKLKELQSELNEVVINAGAFEASDKGKQVIMKPFDIATTAAATGDIYGAFGTMPGSHKVGEEGRLFVRGGESYETKTFMDGMLVNTPYFSKLPDLPTRGRFSPLLFNGAVFSTGAYSAEYGQALSSIVSLNTVALEEKSKSSISIITVGLQGAHAKRWEKSSLAITSDLFHMGLSNKLIKQNIEWIKAPYTLASTCLFRHKTSNTGMVKSMGSASYNSSNLYNQGEQIKLNNSNAYINTTYNEMLGEKWMLNTGVAANTDLEKTFIGSSLVATHKNSLQAKYTFTNFTTENIKIKMGSDYLFFNYKQDVDMDGNHTFQYNNHQLSSFIESEIKVNRIFAVRVGGRVEQSSILKKMKAMPRISSAIKTGKYSQVSTAFGTFYQNPCNDYLKFTSKLKPEKSSHYILTFQYKKDTRTFRIETYHKKYSGLVKFIEEYSFAPNNYSNTGSGYSNGIDIFWRDKKSLGKSDYWVSYSFNNSKRDYRDFPIEARPNYASKHNLSVVYKKFFPKVSVFGAVTYSYASGRPYNNPNHKRFMASRTKAYNDISISLTRLLFIYNKRATIHLVANNLFGFNNIFGYNYSTAPDANGNYQASPVLPASKRMIIALLSIEL